MPNNRSRTRRGSSRRGGSRGGACSSCGPQRGGIFGFGGPRKEVVQAQSAAMNAQNRAAYNVAHSKARVANLGLGMANKNNGSFGELRYTNKERIQSELDDKITQIENAFGVSHEELMDGVAASSTTNPAEVTATVRDLKTRIEQQLAASGPTAAAITLTIPVGVAQLAVKAFRVWLAFVVFCIAVIPSGLFGANLSGPVAAAMPNMSFNTTKSSFSYLKKYFERSRNTAPAAL
jgi:hypothetical protein